MTRTFDSAQPMRADGRHHCSRLVERQEVLIGIKMRRRGEAWFAARVTDISVEGCRLSTTARLESGMTIWVMFPGFEGRPATIIWTGRNVAGCRFAAPLHPAILDYILRMSDPGARV